ncbi:Dihydrolipoyllysine-residue acetyltransferase component of pyruvate dehydrogenase complex [Candidatus Cyrtobacter comes]|uniref:Acetyltransferase component of pyruvate dehydrogenase complex n=1 Tax=Candidatus Cyrtobacter comes TaxID=675776 RepID=A0ABU5L818_9RICK|nr:pyruvate dehydrogenase complex dihydrolipoamide acetyltransferase [Candidatus Cyrtobacter comes]MDZ5762050.1 Dihydrolipoyllysine-residue acetyltransferase component of pyruvate dehydrogenase complex [Candidatus Cyrtobacter comes]
MAIPIFMPALSPTMTDGILSRWIKKEGENVQPGEVIAEIETDKANMEVEAVDGGQIARILIPEGTKKVKVNELIAVLKEENDSDEDVIKIIANNSSDDKKVSSDDVKSSEQAKNPKAIDSISNSTSYQRIFASPLAKRIAKDKGINLNDIKNGSGPRGRIIKKDVLSFSKPIMQHLTHRMEDKVYEVSSIREIIAERLLISKTQIPHFYLTISCSLDKLLQIRQEVNDSATIVDEKPNYKISVNDFIMKASGQAIKAVPQINASWNGDGTITQYGNIDVAVAVATNGGLITPIIRNIDSKPIIEVSNEIKSLVKRAKENKLKPEEFQGGSFSVSNLGMYGIEQFNAIINPPQSCIMAVGAAIQKPIVRNGQIIIEHTMNITLSCDHRIIDGAVAAEFLAAFKNFIEKPLTIFL